MQEPYTCILLPQQVGSSLSTEDGTCEDERMYDVLVNLLPKLSLSWIIVTSRIVFNCVADTRDCRAYLELVEDLT